MMVAVLFAFSGTASADGALVRVPINSPDVKGGVFLLGNPPAAFNLDVHPQGLSSAPPSCQVFRTRKNNTVNGVVILRSGNAIC